MAHFSQNHFAAFHFASNHLHGAAGAVVDDALDRPFVIEHHMGRGGFPYGDPIVHEALKARNIIRERKAKNNAILLDDEDAIMALLSAE